MLLQDKILILYLVKVKGKIMHLRAKEDDNNQSIVYN